MAEDSGNAVHALLREIRDKQEEHSGKLGLVETVAQSVAELHEDMRGMRGEVQDLRAEVQDLGADVKSIRVELEIVHADSHDTRGEIHEMRGDIRDLQADSKEVRKVVGSQRFDFLDERVEMLREGTLTAIGFVANASESNRKLKEQIADLTKRVEKLEQTK
jgi:chromosome segregation ATPase